MSEKEKNEMGIMTLPGNLYAALLEVENSELVKDALGEHIFNKFVENKKIEWDMYRTHVSQYEIEKYMPIT
jgi:glutamine synthetase